MLISRSPRKLSMEENVRWLVKPKPDLDPRLFGKDHRLHPSVREKLLRRADVLFQNCVAPFSLFDIKDVVLCGSADSYFYNEFSDIDMTILLNYRQGEKIFKDSYKAHRFISMRVKEFYQNKRTLYLGERLIDMKTALYINERQLYSVLNNKWIIEASPNVMDGIDTTDVIADATEILRKMDDMQTEQFERYNGKFKLEDLRKMQAFYNELVAMKKTSAHNLLVNKLLCYAGHLHNFRNFYQQEAIKTLSL